MVAEIFIPIVLFLVVGAVLITYIFFRSKERQMIIEKGLDAEQIQELFKRREYPYLMMQIGIIAIGLGVGIGLGMIINEDYMGFFILTFLGIAAVLASLITKKLQAQNES
ncbi:MAG: hypothetical protein D6830_02170 [Ignavibacteria bacterium]|nr:MAG: hypothetical protein D6830_02170 [Ignavibacteria bacterium]